MTDPHADAGRRPAYRIGAAARLTGISTHTLRKWEDRYRLIAPRRSAGGERLYSAADVKRLALIKDLARGGMSLKELAPLSLAELERLFRQGHDARAGERAPELRGRVNVAVVGTALPMLLAQDAPRLRRLRVAAAAQSVAAARAALGEVVPEVLILECPAIGAETGRVLSAAMQALEAPAALVIYGFGTRADLDALRRPDVALVRAPADAPEIERLCLGLVVSRWEHWPAPAVERPLAGDARLPERRWGREALARIAGAANSIACECPRHLADLILSLDAFEAYSASCESRDDKDTALHHYLRVTAATSRALFEEALARVAEHEGLDFDTAPVAAPGVRPGRGSATRPSGRGPG